MMMFVAIPNPPCGRCGNFWISCVCLEGPVAAIAPTADAETAAAWAALAEAARAMSPDELAGMVAKAKARQD